MLFFNKKEIYCGFLLEEYSRIINILSYNKIKYTYKTVNQGTSGNRITGNIGEDYRFRYMYYTYVRNKDFDHAVSLINK